MHEPDFWTNNAEALELSIEGNRLIAREIAELVHGSWLKLVRALDSAIHVIGRHGHQPPV
jgi:hypothetical protein